MNAFCYCVPSQVSVWTGGLWVCWCLRWWLGGPHLTLSPTILTWTQRSTSFKVRQRNLTIHRIYTWKLHTGSRVFRAPLSRQKPGTGRDELSFWNPSVDLLLCSEHLHMWFTNKGYCMFYFFLIYVLLDEALFCLVKPTMPKAYLATINSQILSPSAQWKWKVSMTVPSRGKVRWASNMFFRKV